MTARAGEPLPGRPRQRMYFLYTLLTVIGAVILLPWFALVRLWRGKYLQGLGEKLGLYPASLRASATGGEAVVWIHAVSVGEALAALPLGRLLRERFPGHRVVLSTTTPAGQALARERFAPPFLADGIFYFPLDWPLPVRRAFRAVRPALVVMVETEIWPNFLRHARRCGVPVVFVNGRISERSFARFQRWRWLAGGFFRRVLGDARLFLMQSGADAERLQELGASPSEVEVTGNLKYDITPPAPGPLADWLAAEAGRRTPVVVAGSVLAGEEEAVLEAFAAVRARYPAALLILAPRKPDRFAAAAEIVSRRGHRCLRRTAANLSMALPPDIEILLLDTVGELACLYQFASVTFVGGSLIPGGGHNILEPAACGRVPVFGPHMENFREMAAEFCAENAAHVVRSGGELGRVWLELLEDEPHRTALGQAARRLVERNQGATERTLDRLAAVLQESQPHPERARSLLREALFPLAPIYGLAGWLRAKAYRRGMLRSHRLPATVISVGNLTVGGTGKTPFVGWLAECLLRDGKSAAILSRGYRGLGRGSGPGNASPGFAAQADEPQLLQARLSGRVPIAQGRDRYRAAQPLLARGVEWFVMDDGFQHLQLERDVNIVLIDATDPFGGGLLPAGRAREFRSALGRADLMVITRAVRTPGLEAALRRYSTAPIYYARTVWDELMPISIPSGAMDTQDKSSNGQPRYFAFCGIGNPDAFFSDLRRWSGQLRGTVVGEKSFPDHYRYSADDLSAVERAAREMGGTALVCTEKDARNLPLPLAAGLPLFACRIRLVPADQEAVYRAILQIAAQRRGAAV